MTSTVPVKHQWLTHCLHHSDTAIAHKQARRDICSHFALQSPLTFPFSLGDNPFEHHNIWAETLRFTAQLRYSWTAAQGLTLTFHQLRREDDQIPDQVNCHLLWQSLTVLSVLQRAQHWHAVAATVVLVPHSPTIFLHRDKHENSAANTQTQVPRKLSPCYPNDFTPGFWVNFAILL